MKKFNLIIVSLFIVILQSCGGGTDDSGSGSSSPTTLSGTAATGAAIVGQVKITGSQGNTVTVTIDAAGNYQADVTSLTPPLIITATPTDSSKDKQYSISITGTGIANITPLTTLALFEANGKADLETLIATWSSNSGNISQISLDAQKAIINANFQTFLDDEGIDSALFDLFTSVFNADGNGFDAVLDLISFSVDFNTGTTSISIPSVPEFSFDANINGSGGGSSGASGSLTLTGNGATILGFSSLDLDIFPSQSSSITIGSLIVDIIVWNKIDGANEYTLTVSQTVDSGTPTVLNVTLLRATNGAVDASWTSTDIDNGINVLASSVTFSNVSMNSISASNDLVISGTLTR